MLFFTTLNVVAETFDQAHDHWQKSKDCVPVPGYHLAQVWKLNLLKEDREAAESALRDRYTRLIRDAERLAHAMAAPMGVPV